MTPDRRLLGAALGFALAVSACGGAASSPAASSGASAAASAAPSAAASQAAASTEATSTEATSAPDASAPDISLTPGNAGDLEAMLPDRVGSTTITKTSFDYSSIPWSSLSGLSSDGLPKVLQDNGKSLSDVRFAMGIGTNAGGASMPTIVYALQVKGLDATKFVTGFDSSFDSNASIAVGGKSVKGAISAGYGSITYLHNDVVFIAVGSEADLNALVAALP